MIRGSGLRLVRRILFWFKMRDVFFVREGIEEVGFRGGGEVVGSLGMEEIVLFGEGRFRL